MFDFWPRPERTYAELLLKKMRPGDIHTHVFAQQFPIILPDGKINPIMAEARARGVIFDVGHGAGSFWFRNAVPAVRQGFIPDSISTDLHTLNYTVLSMTQVMSKFLAMGVPLNEIIRRSTVNPAREIRRPELGTLSVGKEADIAVLEAAQRKIQLHRLRLCSNGRDWQSDRAHDSAGRAHSLRSFRPEHGRVGESSSAIFQYSCVGDVATCQGGRLSAGIRRRRHCFSCECASIRKEIPFRAVEGLAVILKFAAYFAGADSFNCGH